MTAYVKTFLKNDIAIAFGIAIIWQLIMTIVGSILLPDSAGRGPLGHMTLWDGAWYIDIIREHYRFNPASPAFYPLFPLAVETLGIVTFNIFNYPLTALLVNTISLGFAIAGLLAIAKHFTTKTPLRYLCIALFLAAPAAFFLHQFYGEAIFAAIGFWAYAFALQKKWLYVGILLAFLTASRLPSLLFVGLCALEYLRAYNWNIKKALNPKILSFLLAPIGFILYGLYLLSVRGNFFAMFSAYQATDDWYYQALNINFLSPIIDGCRLIFRFLLGEIPMTSNLLVGTAIPLFCLLILFITSLYLIFNYRGKGIPLGVFGLISIIFFTLNDNLVSVHRYTLPCLGIYLALTLMYSRHPRLRPVIVAIGIFTLAIQALLVFWLYTTDKFAG